MKFIVALFLSSFIATYAQASTATNAKIIEVRSGTWYGDKITFKVVPAPTPSSASTVACESVDESRGHYAIDLSKPGAYAWFSLIASAKSKGEIVQVWGATTCIDINGVKFEELETIAIQ